jgi:rhodanese-related sulfurtransferase
MTVLSPVSLISSPAPSCFSPSARPAAEAIPQLDLEALPAWLAQGARLVDVREEEERELFGAISDAVELPLLSLKRAMGVPLSPAEEEVFVPTESFGTAERLADLRHGGEPVICFCAHGRRALVAAGLLRRLGVPAFALAAEFTTLAAALAPALSGGGEKGSG